jgi:hypothetical protein
MRKTCSFLTFAFSPVADHFLHPLHLLSVLDSKGQIKNPDQSLTKEIDPGPFAIRIPDIPIPTGLLASLLFGAFPSRSGETVA